MQKKPRFVFITGGVISGVGKGIIAASVGKILKSYGYNITIIKIDPYINYDAGTLRPTEHGEVWVTEDGGEIDQDLGNYERFLNQDIPKRNNITTGQIYKTVIERERSGAYLGKTVQFIPHIVEEIKQRILSASEGFDIVIVELGGTVGDYENTPYLFAMRSLEQELGRNSVAYLLVSYLPVPGHLGEMKTKPTQQSIRLLGEEGILPDFIICRFKKGQLDAVRKKKIQLCANIPENHVIAAPDLSTVYQMPLYLEEQELGQCILDHFKLAKVVHDDWQQWKQLLNAMTHTKQSVRVAIVGKYFSTGNYKLSDSYVSIIEALHHARAHLGITIHIDWLSAQDFEAGDTSQLQEYDGIIIPGGFGNKGVKGKLKVIEYARTHAIPYLGLCYGMQLAVVEFARSVCNLSDAATTENEPKTKDPVVTILPEQQKYVSSSNLGGTMRLGSYPAHLKAGSVVYNLYTKYSGATETVSERHRHRYEINPTYVTQLEAAGIHFSGVHTRKDGTQLMEFVELPSHPFFIGTQAHPEFKSRFNRAHPIFLGFLDACQKRMINFKK